MTRPLALILLLGALLSPLPAFAVGGDDKADKKDGEEEITPSQGSIVFVVNKGGSFVGPDPVLLNKMRMAILEQRGELPEDGEEGDKAKKAGGK